MAVDVVAAIRSSDYNAARGMVWEFDNAKEHPDLINGG
jgi:hypothetical protein